MRKVRRDYDLNFARSLYVARKRDGKLIEEITYNKALNPKGLKAQRISNIINYYEDQISSGRIKHEE